MPSFHHLRTILENPDGDPTAKSTLPVVLDELGRLRAWAGNSGAHRPATHKLSLDHRLREASHIHQRFTGLLSDLNEDLEDGMASITFRPTEYVVC